MRKSKKLWMFVLSLVFAVSASFGIMAFAAGSDDWSVNTMIDKRADANGWVTNYIAAGHTTEHTVANGMSTLTQASGGPAYNAVNLYPLIKAGKEITFTVDNTESGTGGTYMGFGLLDQKPEPWNGNFNFVGNSATTTPLGLIENTVGWQIFPGASANQAIQNPLNAGKHKITFFIGKNKGESYMKMDDTVMQGETGRPEAGKSILSQVTTADYTKDAAYLFIVGVNTECTVSVSAINAPAISDVTGTDTAISASSPNDITAKVTASGTPKLAVTNKAGEIVNVPAEYYTYDSESKLLTIKKEVFSARAAESYLPLNTLFYITDDYGYNTISVKVSYQFDANGWNTALLEGNTHGTTGGAGASLAAPKLVDGYTSYGHNVARIYNNTKLDLTKPISFEFAIASNDAAANTWWYRIMLVDSTNAEADIVVSDPIGGATDKKPTVGMIFKTDYSAAQIPCGAAANSEIKLDKFGIAAKTYGKATEVDKKVTVKITIGETAEDSKIYLNGKAAFDLNVTRADFPSGKAQLAFFPQGGTDLIVSSLNNTPAIDSIDHTLWSYEDPKDVTLKVTDAVTLDAASVKVGYTERLTSVSALQKAKYTYLDEGDFTVSGNTVTIKSETFLKHMMPAQSYIKIETADGCSTTVLNVKNGEIDYIGGSKFTTKLDLSADYTINFKFKGAESFELSQTIASTSDGAAALTDAEYAIGGTAADETRTLTLKKDYLNSLEAGVYHFFLKTGAGNLDWYLYLEPAEDGWVVRSTKGTITDNTDDAYQTLHLNAHSASNFYTAGRAFYSKGFDVTKPIFFELEFPVDSDGWSLLGMSDTPYTFEYFNENSKTTQLASLFQPKANSNGIRWEPFSGFTVNPSIAIDSYFNENNLNLFEFYIGTTDDAGDDPGYVKFNGNKLSTMPKVLQSDFKSKKVYLGWFKGTGSVTFKINDPNAVAVKDLNDDILKYTLGSTSDFDVELVNNSENLTVIGADGEPLDSSLYTVNGSVLSIFKEYFNVYRQRETFKVVDNENKTQTQFTITYDVTITGSGDMAFIDAPGDVEIAVDALASEISAVIIDGTELGSDLYTAEDGKITLKAANFTEEGEYIFVVAAKGGYIPLYVSYRSYENGGIQLNAGASGAGSVTVTDEKYAFTEGEINYQFEKSVDFSKSIEFMLTIDKVSAALNDGNEIDTAGYFGFRFEDIYSGYSVEYRVYANWLETDSEARKVAVYGFIFNSAGAQVDKRSYTYASGLYGEHRIRIGITEFGFEIMFDDQANTILFDLDSYPMFTDNMLFSFTSPAAGQANRAVAGSVDFKIPVPEYHITANEGVTVDATAKEGDLVGFTVAEKEGYTYTVSVKQGGTELTVTDGTFTMPAGDVSITVTYTKKDVEDPDKPGTGDEDNNGGCGGCGGSVGGIGGGIGGGLILLGLAAIPFVMKKRRNEKK